MVPGERYAPRLFEHITRGELDPSYMLTQRRPLENGPQGYEMFKRKDDGCMRVVFDPRAPATAWHRGHLEERKAQP